MDGTVLAFPISRLTAKYAPLNEKRKQFTPKKDVNLNRLFSLVNNWR